MTSLPPPPSPPNPTGEPPESRNDSSAWRELEKLEARLRSVETALRATPPAEGWFSRLLGKQLTVTSVIALASGLLALFLSVRGYLQSLPSHNIRSLGVQVDPFPMYFWYSRYFLGVPVAGAADLDPRLKDEKANRFAAIQDARLARLYLPGIQVVNEGSRVYSITRVRISGGPAWQFERPPSLGYVRQALVGENKYERVGMLSSDPRAATPSALLKPGDVLVIFPDVIARLVDGAPPEDAWLEIALLSGDRELVAFGEDAVVPPEDPVGVLLAMGGDPSTVRDALATAFRSAGFERLAAALGGRATGAPAVSP